MFENRTNQQHGLDPSRGDLQPPQRISKSRSGRLCGAVNLPDKCNRPWRAWIAFYKQDKFEAAIRDWRESNQILPNNKEVLNGLAWVLATCPSASLRNGTEAVKIATALCELTNWSDWGSLDTLAAAHAESGTFDKAMQYQKQALSFTSIGNADRETLEARLSLYKNSQAYREDSVTHRMP